MLVFEFIDAHSGPGLEIHLKQAVIKNRGGGLAVAGFQQ